MKNIKKLAVLLLTAAMLYTLTGCSFTESWKLLWGSKESDAMTAEEIQKMKEEKVIKNVNESLEAPVFNVDLGQSVTYQVGASADTLTVEATVTSGTITYQWYSNNAASNGGGTPIEGATEPTYTPSTAEKGTMYYFCVATNTVNDSIRMSTSQLAAVVVEDDNDMSILPAEEMGGGSEAEQ